VSSHTPLFVIPASHSTPSAGGFIGAVLGSSGRDYILWSEAQTMVYLKISLSDFLTLFAARTRTWFWERRPGYALGVACIAATSTSTVMSLFWDDIVKTEDAQMSGLRHSSYACVAVWIYCILWFFAQDVAKVIGYAILEYLTKADSERVAAQAARGQITAMMDADRKAARLHGVTGAKDVSFATAEELSGVTSSQSALEGRVKGLEKEIAELKALLKAVAVTKA
jgi:hypothetical protein